MFRQHVPDFSGRLDTVHTGHFPIQKHKVKPDSLLMSFSNLPDSIIPAERIPDRHPSVFHDTNYIYTDAFIIIHNQHTGNPVVFPKLFIHILFLNAQFQIDSKNTSFALSALYINGSAHQLHQIFCNRHPKAGSLDLVRHTVDLAGKWFKNNM